MTHIAALPHIIRIDDAAYALGRADRRTYYRWAHDGIVPPVVRVGPARSGVIASELAAVIAARARGAGDDAVRELVREIVARRGSA